MIERYIPFEVQTDNNKRNIWYINLNNMSIGELTELRKRLLGTLSIKYIDRVINDLVKDYTHSFANNKALKRDCKYNKMLKRKKGYKKKGGRK